MVLFVNMILIINLLIAIMSDTYSRMSNKRIGLYWSTVIKEMPKFRYHSTYGVLVMLPFVLSWIGFLCIPFFCCLKSQSRLRQINDFSIKYVFSIYAVILLAIFMSVNLVLMPFAYLKSLAHKVVLFKHYHGADQLKNVLFFAILGVPLLLFS